MPKLSELVPLVDQYAAKAGIDPSIPRAALFAENSGNDGVLDLNKDISLNTTSPTGALGVGQVLPSSLRNLQSKGLLPPDLDYGTAAGQVQAMVAHLADAQKRYGNDPTKMLLDYQGGPNAVNAFVNSNGDISGLPEQARNYLAKAGKHVSLTYHNSSYPEGVMDGVIAAGDKYKQSADKILAAIQGINDNFSGEVDAAGSAATAAGTAKANAIRLGAGIAADKLDTKQSILTTFGIDPAASDSRISQLNQQAAVAQQAITNLQPQLDALRSVSFVDDPIAWVKAQLQLDGVSKQYNNAAMAFNRSTSMVGTLQQLGGNQVALQPGTSRDALVAEADAQATEALQNAQLDKFRITAAGRQAQISQFATQLQVANFDFSHTKDLARMQQDRTALRVSDANAAKEVIQLDGVNKFRSMLGLDPYTPEQFKVIPAKEKDYWLSRGSKSNSYQVADKPGDAVETLYDTQSYGQFRKNLSVQAANFYDNLGVTAQKMSEKLYPGDPKKQAANFSNAINGRFDAWRNELKDRDYTALSNDNPFRMNGTIFAQATALKDNTIAQWVKALPQQGAMAKEKDVLSYALSQVQAGKPREAVTEELRQFFYEGTLHQHSELRLPMMGVDIKNPISGQVEYPINGDVFGLLDRFKDPRKANSTTKNLQLFNSASIDNFLILNAAAQKRYDELKLYDLPAPDMSNPNSMPLGGNAP